MGTRKALRLYVDGTDSSDRAHEALRDAGLGRDVAVVRVSGEEASRLHLPALYTPEGAFHTLGLIQRYARAHCPASLAPDDT